MKDEPEQRPLTTGEIAQYCHVTHRAVLKWVAAGKLKAFRTPGKHSRVNTDDFLQFLKQYDMPVPKGLRQRDHVHQRILVVDDDRGIVHAVQRMLMMESTYIVEVAYDGFEAGQKFSDFRPDFIILDINMPGMNGYDVCAKIRKDPKNNNIKILAISGVYDTKEIQKIIDLGADDYLQKPFSNQGLHDKIKALME